LNPLAEIFTEYSPGGNNENLYTPEASVVVVRSWPVALLSAVTMAPTTTPLDGSVIVPVNAPVVADCAHIGDAHAKITAKQNASARKKGGSAEFLLMTTPVKRSHPTSTTN
jgi:hypothetical protein